MFQNRFLQFSRAKFFCQFWKEFIKKIRLLSKICINAKLIYQKIYIYTSTVTEVYSELCTTCRMEYFVKTFNVFDNFPKTFCLTGFWIRLRVIFTEIRWNSAQKSILPSLYKQHSFWLIFWICLTFSAIFWHFGISSFKSLPLTEFSVKF